MCGDEWLGVAFNLLRLKTTEADILAEKIADRNKPHRGSVMVGVRLTSRNETLLHYAALKREAPDDHAG